jgi:hypothetical protein
VNATDRAPTEAGEAAADHAEHVHRYLSDYIKFADQKATFVFGGAAALLAFLYKAEASRRWLKPVGGWTLGDALAFLAMLALAAAALVAVAVIVPRLGGSRRGLIFWESIAQFESGAEYAAAVTGVGAADLLRAKLQHCWELSGVCRRKYRVLGVAIWLGAVGLYAAVVFLLFF